MEKNKNRVRYHILVRFQGKTWTIKKNFFNFTDLDNKVISFRLKILVIIKI